MLCLFTSTAAGAQKATVMSTYDQVDGARNPKIQSIYLDKFPIHQAAFAAGGTHVVASSRRRHFYTFDLASASVEKVCPGLAPSSCQGPL